MRLEVLAVLGFIATIFAAAGCASRPASMKLPEEEYGFDRGTFGRIDRVFREQERRGHIPAATIAIRREGYLVYTNAFGRTRPGGDGERVTPQSRFDVASLTKSLAGVPAAILLATESQITPAERSLLPRLLQHSLGLNDTLHYPTLRGIEEYFDPQTLRQPRYRYANSNYLYLTFRVDSEVPDALAELHRQFWRRMGMRRVSFQPGEDAVWSGRDGAGRTIVGSPYDPVASMLLARGHGFTLHSGLFADAEEVSLYADALLRYRQNGDSISMLRDLLFDGVQTLPMAGESNAVIDVTPGGMLSPRDPPYAHVAAPPGRYFYQTGYTGCLLWVDSRTGTVVALLSNAAAGDARREWREFAEDIIQIVRQGTTERRP